MKLQEVMHMIRQIRNEMVVLRGFFEQHIQNVVPPVHPLTGIEKKLIEGSFHRLRTSAQRRELDNVTKFSLARIRFRYQWSVYNYVTE